MGVNIKYFDPYISEYKYKGEIYQGEKELTKELLEAADLVMITTSHLPKLITTLCNSTLLLFLTLKML